MKPSDEPVRIVLAVSMFGMEGGRAQRASIECGWLFVCCLDIIVIMEGGRVGNRWLGNSPRDPINTVAPSSAAVEDGEDADLGTNYNFRRAIR